MAAVAKTALNESTFKLCFTPPPPLQENSLKPTSHFHFSDSIMVSFGGLDLKSKIIARSKLMPSSEGLVKIYALRKEDNGRNSTEFASLLIIAENFEAILNGLSKWVAFVILVGVLVWRNDAKSLWAAMGCAVNFILCVTLKRIINQQRPVLKLKSDPGMPSSHAQSVFYIFVVSILSVIEREGVNELTLIMAAIALACGSYLSWLRVSQQFHTMSQVVVGGAVGSVFSILWFWWWDAVVQEAFNSFYWVRAIVAVGVASFTLSFVLHLIRDVLITDKY